MELLGLGRNSGPSIKKKKNQNETEILEVIKIKHNCVIPGDKYVALQFK
jgi:hypothetical protein